MNPNLQTSYLNLSKLKPMQEPNPTDEITNNKFITRNTVKIKYQLNDLRPLTSIAHQSFLFCQLMNHTPTIRL